jgi:rhodanese-related sulfurtransferase
MGLLSILGIGSGVKDALRKGAAIIDIRTAHEFDQGKIKGSINIPVDRISINLERIRNMRKPIVICGYSYSDNDKTITTLKANGIKDVYNGGSWTRVLKITKSL